MSQNAYDRPAFIFHAPYFISRGAPGQPLPAILWSEACFSVFKLQNVVVFFETCATIFVKTML
jgi:hypothetical protein